MTVAPNTSFPAIPLDAFNLTPGAVVSFDPDAGVAADARDGGTPESDRFYVVMTVERDLDRELVNMTLRELRYVPDFTFPYSMDFNDRIALVGLVANPTDLGDDNHGSAALRPFPNARN